MENNTAMRLELPQEINDLILEYKRALKRNTGQNKNKDAIILEVLENNAETLRQKINRLNADWANFQMQKVKR